MRFTKQSWILLVVVAFLFAGCKKEEKKGEENKKAKVEKKEPAANEPAAQEETAANVEDVVESNPVEAKAPVDGEEPDVISGDAVAEKEAPAEAKEGIPAMEDETAKEGEAEEEPAAPEAKEEAAEVAGDIVAEVVEEDPHFGREFKLDAIMLMSELVNQPEYYSSFESLKVRAPVVAQQGNLVLLEMKTKEGTTYYICARMDASPEGGIGIGDVLYVEGKLVKEGWEPGALGKGDLGNTESNSFDTNWLFAVEAGEPGE